MDQPGKQQSGDHSSYLVLDTGTTGAGVVSTVHIVPGPVRPEMTQTNTVSPCVMVGLARGPVEVVHVGVVQPRELLVVEHRPQPGQCHVVPGK